MYTTFVSTAELAAHLQDPQWVIVDCRHRLVDPQFGRQAYQAGHIPGAVFAHMDEDLSSPVQPGVTGRHPLPEPEVLAQRLGSWGIGPGVQVVAYDDNPGAPGAMAARLWWLLRWLGHDAAAVLDGGWGRWLADECPVREGLEQRAISGRPPAVFIPRLRPELLVDSQQVDFIRSDASQRLFDSRSLDRYRGENETIDPVAGHIPGTRPAPFAENLAPDGTILAPEQLRQRFAALLDGIPAANSAFYCGSGVTAAHNLLALVHAGLGEGRLYAGSWSEWITDPKHPVATGPEPDGLV